jgi:hypothetical protein
LIYKKLLGHDDLPLITKHLYNQDQYLVFITLVTPHKIDNFADNTFSSATPQMLSALSKQVKILCNLKKFITKTAISRKTNNLF